MQLIQTVEPLDGPVSACPQATSRCCVNTNITHLRHRNRHASILLPLAVPCTVQTRSQHPILYHPASIHLRSPSVKLLRPSFTHVCPSRYATSHPPLSLADNNPLSPRPPPPRNVLAGPGTRLSCGHSSGRANNADCCPVARDAYLVTFTPAPAFTAGRRYQPSCWPSPRDLGSAPSEAL